MIRAGVAAGLVAVLAGVSAPALAAPSKHTDTLAKSESCDVYSGSTFTDPLKETPWPLRRLQPERAWPLSRGQGIKVAVVDSGVANTPEVLKDAVYEGGKDYLASGNGTCDQYGHGTLVAAIIAGRDGSGSPFHGVAPGAEILPYRVLRDNQRDNSENTPSAIADAIRKATDAGAKVINLSLTTQPTDALKKAVKYAQERDVLLVAAAGNEGGTDAEGSAEYPAAMPGVLAVGGINEKGGHVGSSNTASYLEVAAPGDKIEGPAPAGGGYLQFPEGGTSFAAPYVSGVAALIRAYHPDLTAYQVRERIIKTADHPPQGWNETVGYGVVDPYRALTAVLRDDAGPAPDATGNNEMTDPQQLADPLRTVKIAAGVTAVVLLAVAFLVFVGARVVPRGRRREWRSGRASFAPDAEGPAPKAPASTPSDKPVSITAPSSRAKVPSGPGTARGGPAGPPRAIPGGARAVPGAGRR